MSLTPEQIQKFEAALNGPAPEGDPNWEVTQQLLKLVVLQAREILSLQAQLASVSYGNLAATRNIIEVLRLSSGASVSRAELDPNEVQHALSELNQAIEAYQQGEAVTRYAAQALKFAALLI